MHVEFEPYHRSEILHGHLHLGGSNPGGERIEVNSLCLTRGGQPWLPVMGEFHFSRCDPAQWQTELCKMKAGGVTMVSTYLFWIHHEEREGELRFSGRLDVRRFVLCCRRAGLDVVLRIGPWAHGECRNGGFPDWLLHKGIPLRQNHPAYLALVRAWYRSIYRQVRGLLYRDGGPIVGIQLENELVDNSDHLAALKRIAVEEGFEVPLYTVTGWNAVSGARIPTAEVLPVFAAYPDAPWTQHRDPLPLSPQYLFNPTRNDTAVGADLLHTAAPDGWQLPYDRYPFATCEIGAGQQSTYHRRVRISGMDAYALSLVKLGCGNNLIGYYMYHGGTNPIGRDSTLQESRATGYPNDYPILNYDFATALSQYGETRPQYRWLNLLHLLAADFGRELARMEYVSSLTHPTPEDRQTLRCCLRTDGTAGFVFVNHHQRHAALCPVSDVVLDTGTVCFPPITVAGDLAFLFPFGLSLGGRTLRWATAQPICRSGDTWFFAAIPGIPARYRFTDGTLVTAGQGIAVQTAGPVRLVTLPLGQALWLRRLGQRIVLGQGCDLYEEDGTIRAVQPGSFRYLLWQDDHFVPREETRSFTPAQLTMTPCPEPFAPPYEEELCLGGRVPRHWYRLEVSGSEGFLRFPQRCDVAQIYADGALAADNFYNGEPWRVPASLLYGRQCYLVMTPPSDAVFMDP